MAREIGEDITQGSTEAAEMDGITGADRNKAKGGVVKSFSVPPRSPRPLKKKETGSETSMISKIASHSPSNCRLARPSRAGQPEYTRVQRFVSPCLYLIKEFNACACQAITFVFSARFIESGPIGARKLADDRIVL